MAGKNTAAFGIYRNRAELERGVDELKAAGLLDSRLPDGLDVPLPSDDPALREDEDPLEDTDLDFGLAPPASRVDEE